MNTRMSSSCLMCKPFSTSDTAPAHRVTPRPLLHLTREECGRVQGGAHTGGMPVRLHHIVIDAHDLPALARFWTQALGWTVLSERANRSEEHTSELQSRENLVCRLLLEKKKKKKK